MREDTVEGQGSGLKSAAVDSSVPVRAGRRGPCAASLTRPFAEASRLGERAI